MLLLTFIYLKKVMHATFYTSKILPINYVEKIVIHIYTVNLLHKSIVFFPI